MDHIQSICFGCEGAWLCGAGMERGGRDEGFENESCCFLQNKFESFGSRLSQDQRLRKVSPKITCNGRIKSRVARL